MNNVWDQDSFYEAQVARIWGTELDHILLYNSPPQIRCRIQLTVRI